MTAKEYKQQTKQNKYRSVLKLYEMGNTIEELQHLCDLSKGSNEVLERMKQEALKRACHVKMDEVEE